MTTREKNGPPPEAELDMDVSLSSPGESCDSPGIRIDPIVREQIERFAATDTSTELAGVLLGELLTNGPHPEVLIHAAIEAKYTEAVHTSVKFTHATWDDINKVKDEQYPEMRMVGWFHTHPGFGIFLSRWDTFIQENFFNLPWQVAYVVDPIAKTNGFFRWENGNIVAVDRKTPRAEPVELTVAHRGFPWAAVLSGALNVGLAAALVYFAFFRAPEVRTITRVRPRAAAGVRTVTVVKTKPALGGHVVQSGDSWWRIAETELGDGTLWPAVRAINSPELAIGESISIPDKELAKKLVTSQCLRKSLRL